MPMYYPDLKSVKDVAKAMTKNEGDKKYRGIIPKKESELLKARRELGYYFRTVWGDEIAALEVEISLTKENYHDKMGEHVKNNLLAS